MNNCLSKKITTDYNIKHFIKQKNKILKILLFNVDKFQKL